MILKTSIFYYNNENDDVPVTIIDDNLNMIKQSLFVHEVLQIFAKATVSDKQ